MQRELNALRGNAAFLESIGAQDLSDPDQQARWQSFVARWTTLDMRSLLIQRFIDARNIAVSNAAIERASAALNAGFGTDASGASVFAGFPVWFQVELATRQARDEAALRAVQAQDVATYFRAHEAELTGACASKKVVRHILVQTRTEADQIAAQLAAGADFAAVAAKVSLDKGSAAVGGLLGCYEPKTFVEAFETVVASLPIGGRGIATTQFGVHVIEVVAMTQESLVVETKAAMEAKAGEDLNAYMLDQLQSQPAAVNSRFGKLVVTDTGFQVVGADQAGGPRIRTQPTSSSDTASSLLGR